MSDREEFDKAWEGFAVAIKDLAYQAPIFDFAVFALPCTPALFKGSVAGTVVGLLFGAAADWSIRDYPLIGVALWLVGFLFAASIGRKAAARASRG